jgi:formylglycine-generating enzyme required for sulfatase activity
MKLFSLLLLLGAVAYTAPNTDAFKKEMVQLPQGKFVPFTSKAGSNGEKNEVTVNSFFLDKSPVTNGEYLQFVKTNPEWQRSNIRAIFSDNHYLENWKDNLKISDKQKKMPVTYISWFAASAYCESLGKRLPTTNEWEFALFDQGHNQEALRAKILKWYSMPNSSEVYVNQKDKNGYGVSGLGFVVWEWTDDFNSFLASGDARESNPKGDSNLFCGNGSQMGNPSDYPAFMRYSFRSSLKANYTTANLGFRCAKDVEK